MRARVPAVGPDAGFALMETLVAAVILVVGLLGTFLLVDTANGGDARATAREGATALSRELLEDARTLPYGSITSGDGTGLAAQLQPLVNAATQSGNTLQVLRRRITFTATLTVCAIDDPSDGMGGSHTTPQFCTATSSTDTSDSQPEDFKQVNAAISWTDRGRTFTATQSTLLSSSGAAVGPAVTALTLDSPTGGANPAAPVVTASPASAPNATLTATVHGAASVVFAVDGQDQPSGSVVHDGANPDLWHFTWPIGSLSDGDYSITARAKDPTTGASGATRQLTVRLARGLLPAAPASLVGGWNYVNDAGVRKAVVELDWTPNAERNVVGYRVRNYAGATISCPANPTPTGAQNDRLATNCIDFAAGTPGGSITYQVNAIYTDASGNELNGPSSTVTFTGTSASPVTTRTWQRYYFGGTTANTGDSLCYTGANPRRDLTPTAPTGTTSTFGGLGALGAFCTAILPSGTALAATTQSFSTDFQNTGTAACPVDFALGVDGNISSPTYYSASAGTTLSIAPSGAPVTVTKSFSVPNTDLSNHRLNFGFVMSSTTTTGCGATKLFYGGATDLGWFDLNFDVTKSGAGAWPQPAPPTGITRTTNAGGTVTLTWNGNGSSFYRVYKNGTDWTNRIQTTGSSTDATVTTYVPGTATDRFWISAVNTNLAESSLVGPS